MEQEALRTELDQRAAAVASLSAAARGQAAMELEEAERLRFDNKRLEKRVRVLQAPRRPPRPPAPLSPSPSPSPSARSRGAP